MKTLEPPPGCMVQPGYILPVFGGKFWFTMTGDLTDVWSRRGVWPTEAEARAAKDEFLEREGLKLDS